MWESFEARHMGQQQLLERLDYRAVEGTNTKTRRLAYLTAIVSMLGHNSLGKRVLLTRIARWSQDHRPDLSTYWVQTGEVTSTRRNSAGARYLHLTMNLGLSAPISGAYRATRVGLVLFALIDEKRTNANPFFLTHAECIFYLYLLLDQDADILLTVTDYLEEHPGASLAQLQRDFQEAFLHRLNHKISLSRDDIVRQSLLERRGQVESWRKPERYAEHIVPPRLNWLLDLGFLEPGRFRRHRYFFTETGRGFLSELPRLGDSQLRDVSGDWLESDFWMAVACGSIDKEALVRWDQVDGERRQEVCAPLLEDVFKAFRHTAVPKVSLTQALLYLGVRLVLEQGIGAGPASLKTWLSAPQTLDGRRYEVRFSPRENESYLIVMSE
jgi:hypothetical protein